MDNLSATSKGNVLALHQAVLSYDVDSTTIFEAVNIDLSRLDDTHREVTGEMMDRMICMAVELTADPAFGLRFAEFIQPTSYHALGVALLYSPTLRSFCQRLERYFAMITTSDKSHFVDNEEGIYLSTTPVINYSSIQQRCHSDAWSAWIVKLIRLMYRRDFSPEKIYLVCTEGEADKEQYQQYFQTDIHFSAAETRIYIEADILDVSLPISNVELARQNDQVIVEYLAKMAKADLPSRVRAKIIEFLPSGECSKEKVALSLNMSVRTLHNRLITTEISYQQLLEETRQQLAKEYIERNEVSVSEVAYLLGFSDISSFSRAFKKWTGLSPRKYLQSLLKQSYIIP